MVLDFGTPDFDDISFDANMLADHELSDPKLRLIETILKLLYQ